MVAVWRNYSSDELASTHIERLHALRMLRDGIALGPTFTFDLEQHRADGNVRYEAITHQVLDALAELEVKGTFFVVADVASTTPSLIRRIAQDGHEIASHDLVHVSWESRTPKGLREDLRRARGELEDLVGLAVRGVRAPFFSLTARTPWAPEVLSEVGFEYSSSVLPAVNPISGFPGVPRHPFRWPTGLVEFPVPLHGRGRLSLPLLGGFYLRFAAMRSIRSVLAEPRGQALWTYVHAYDLDPDEPRSPVHGSGRFLTLLLALGRHRTWPRLAAIHGGDVSADPFAQRLDQGEFTNTPLSPSL